MTSSAMLLLVCVLLSAVHAQQISVRVNTTQGVVVGSNAADGNYVTFYGIHYGGSASGENRFKAPTPAPVYHDGFNATDTDVICAQPSHRGLMGVEDCLVLNVFTNNVTNPKPVLVWLVNEEYTKSDLTKRTFNKLVEKDIVVVQLNYRLSIFGFLCLGTVEAPGNAGLKDIVQGLKWINQNIAGFGGDPHNVVLFGHGSGAAMVDLITMSPLASNLVHKAIALSGSALAPWAIALEPLKYASTFGEKLSYHGKTGDELAKLLAGSDINLLVNALNEFEFTNNSVLFAPCIENQSLNNTFLNDAPINLLRSGDYSQIPYLAGYTDLEGTIRAPEAATWLTKMQDNFTEFLPVDLNLGSNDEKQIRDFYFKQKNISSKNKGDNLSFLFFEGDTTILVSVLRGVKERALTSRSPVRLLEFAYVGAHNNDWNYTNIPLIGARHGSILNFVLGYDLRPIVHDAAASNSLIARLTEFAKTGVPTPSSYPTTWGPVKIDRFEFLRYEGGRENPINEYHLGGGNESSTNFMVKLGLDPQQQKMTFWNDLYAKNYKAPKAVSSVSSAQNTKPSNAGSSAQNTKPSNAGSSAHNTKPSNAGSSAHNTIPSNVGSSAQNTIPSNSSAQFTNATAGSSAGTLLGTVMAFLGVFIVRCF